MSVTRLAPSPTGALHLGNARTFLINFLLARQNNWKLRMRIEDIDSPRVKPQAAAQVIADLQWLGVGWDGDIVYQSQRGAIYSAALQKLLDSGVAYPCVCTRREVELSASAPHAEDGAAVYPGTCRDKFKSIDDAIRITGRAPAIRFDTRSRTVRFVDEFAGERTFDVERELGDFVIAKADLSPAYQLAVVVDDAEMGVTHVVRGDDLLDSTPRQILLYQALGLESQIPQYTHLPLVIGEDGRRLAKRHGDTRLSHYHSRGLPAAAVIRLLAEWCGITAAEKLTCADDLVGLFDLRKLPRQPVVFTAEADRRLLSEA